ncbi:MAG: hypothetical protein IPI68_04610 [Chitinophagaceae bacterium]|nr:hypothetical protein [Chitinophagaceae bacterium]
MNTSRSMKNDTDIFHARSMNIVIFVVENYSANDYTPILLKHFGKISV